MNVPKHAIVYAPALCLFASIVMGAQGSAALPAAQNFANSTEHYNYLLRLHKGGTRHTYQSVPKWEGLWRGAGNTATALFVKGGEPGSFTGGEIIPGVLTPAYEAAPT